MIPFADQLLFHVNHFLIRVCARLAVNQHLASTGLSFKEWILSHGLITSKHLVYTLHISSALRV